MNIRLTLILFCYCVIITCTCAQNTSVKSLSIYQEKPLDTAAVYFTPENFKIKPDGKNDVSDELQKAINDIKSKKSFGILFIPEGTYLITKTIYIPTAIRLIGYGKNRPKFVLAKNSPGFNLENSEDKGKANYMFWFTVRLVEPGQPVRDANAGTFYSAFSNIDLKIEDGNPQAVALRTHYAQHSFISYCDIFIGNGKAGMFDVGNEMQNVRFFGGDYGFYTTKTSPGWQFMMVDTYFEGQRKAAIKTHEAGLTIVRMNVKNVPTVIDIDSGYYEKLFMEHCQLDNVSGPAIIISNEGNAFNQISMRNVICRNVPLLAHYRRSGRAVKGSGKIYKIKNFIDGLHIDDLQDEPEFKTINEMENLKDFSITIERDIPDLPPMQTWVNLKALGAKGNGETDDTKVLQEAINKYQTIYIPQGWYKVSETIKMKPNTILIGLHPIATQLILADNTLAFGSFGGPKPVLEAPPGGTNIVNGIGISTGAYNNRAVACKWMAGEKSYMNDVKFVGGHGTMTPGPLQPRVDQPQTRIKPGIDIAWDTQYWSLWITNGGGGTFKDIWTASTFAASGLYVSNTSTPARIYAMSVEHHVRNEVRFKKVSNWKVYALQLEEESIESSYAEPLELDECSNMTFTNFYIYRVTRINTPYHHAIRTWSCKNIEFLNLHNFCQLKYASTNSLYDINSDTEIRPWEFVRLYISGNEQSPQRADSGTDVVKKLAKGFEFADGICRDSKGNIYFSEARFKRIYKWSVQTNAISLLADYPWEPLSLACDKNDNLLVVFKYIPRPGYLINGKTEEFPPLQDVVINPSATSNSSGFGIFAYAINPDSPDETIQLLKKISMDSVKSIHKVLYPANRRREAHDFSRVLRNKPKEVYMAPDGETIIPVTYDLGRANGLIESFPGKSVYVTDEYSKRTAQLNVTNDGCLTDLTFFAERGEFSSAIDANGNVYIADGQIYIYTKAGRQIGQIKIHERPVTVMFGGLDHKTLFVTTHEALYCVKVQ